MTDTQKDHFVEIQGNDGHLQAVERGLRKNPIP